MQGTKDVKSDASCKESATPCTYCEACCKANILPLSRVYSFSSGSQNLPDNRLHWHLLGQDLPIVYLF